MLGDACTIEYLETFRRQLDEAADYITFELGNAIAAESLLADVKAAIQKISAAPLVTRPYATDPITGDVYYRINVRNFSVFYVVIGHVMEVRWFRYAKRRNLIGEAEKRCRAMAAMRRNG